jgi:hypothetical protein
MGLCHSSSKTVIPKSDNIIIESQKTIIHLESSKISHTSQPEKTCEQPKRSDSPISTISTISQTSVNRYPKVTISGVSESKDSIESKDSTESKESRESEKLKETKESVTLDIQIVNKPKLIIIPGFDEIYRILLDFSAAINITNDQLLIILNEIKDNYHNYPYHNLKHALIFTFNQLQFCHYNHDILVQKFAEYNINMSYNKFFILFILSGFAHDIGHIGLSNTQLRELNHEWAISNNNSPAEHFHAKKFIDIILKNNIILSDYEQFIFYDLILSTSLEISNTIFTTNTIFKYIMRFSDLSHWCSNINIHLEWYKRLLREINYRESMFFDFFEQINLNNKNAFNQLQFSQIFFEIISYLNSNIPENVYMLSINKKFSDNISFWTDKSKFSESFFI